MRDTQDVRRNMLPSVDLLSALAPCISWSSDCQPRDMREKIEGHTAWQCRRSPSAKHCPILVAREPLTRAAVDEGAVTENARSTYERESCERGMLLMLVRVKLALKLLMLL